MNLIKFQSLIGRDYLLTEKVGESDNADVIVFQKHARMVHNRLGWKRLEVLIEGIQPIRMDEAHSISKSSDNGKLFT